MDNSTRSESKNLEKNMQHKKIHSFKGLDGMHISARYANMIDWSA